MTNRERAEEAADDWRRADGVQPLVPFIERAIADALAESAIELRDAAFCLCREARMILDCCGSLIAGKEYRELDESIETCKEILDSHPVKP